MAPTERDTSDRVLTAGKAADHAADHTTGLAANLETIWKNGTSPQDGIPPGALKNGPKKHKKTPKRRRVTVPWIRKAPHRGRPLVMVTAYDYQQARTAEAAEVDMVLVGDSLAMVVLGHDDTLALTMEEMLHHVRAVRRGLENPLLVADMPYGSFHLGPQDAVRNALRLMKEGGAQAVKIEGARPEIISALAAAEIPVMAHLGLTPQSIHRFGGFKVQGRGNGAEEALLAAAEAVQEAGAFSLVLECIPSHLAQKISQHLDIPTIGIGAGIGCHGQVLVYHDVLGLEERIAPRFVRRYGELGTAARHALKAFAQDVREGKFPAPEEGYGTTSPAATQEPTQTTPPPPQRDTSWPVEKIYG